MAVRSGIGSQIGIAPESTYGTYVAPTKFLPASKADLKKVKNTVVPSGVVAGQLGQLGAWRRTTTRGASGSIELAAMNRSLGLLLQALMGTTVTPVQQGATTAYLQTHTLADTFGKSLTMQTGIPDLSTGTVRAYSFTGCKVTDAEFTFEVDKEVSAKFGIDAQDVSEVQGLAAASYPTMRPFVGTDASIKIGATFGAETAVAGVKKASVKIGRSLKADRFYLGGATKAEPVIGGYAAITGTITADFVDKTVFADRFAADTAFSLVLEATGALIASTFYDTLRITLPGCFLDGDTPVADGVDVVSGDFPFTWLHDGTNLPKIEVISTDSTL